MDTCVCVGSRKAVSAWAPAPCCLWVQSGSEATVRPQGCGPGWADGGQGPGHLPPHTGPVPPKAASLTGAGPAPLSSHACFQSRLPGRGLPPWQGGDKAAGTVPCHTSGSVGGSRPRGASGGLTAAADQHPIVSPAPHRGPARRAGRDCSTRPAGPRGSPPLQHGALPGAHGTQLPPPAGLPPAAVAWRADP